MRDVTWEYGEKFCLCAPFLLSFDHFGANPTSDPRNNAGKYCSNVVCVHQPFLAINKQRTVNAGIWLRLEYNFMQRMIPIRSQSAKNASFQLVKPQAAWVIQASQTNEIGKKTGRYLCTHYAWKTRQKELVVWSFFGRENGLRPLLLMH